MKVAAKNALLLVSVFLACLLILEGLTRLFLDDGMLYELEMWKYARDIKVRDERPDVGHRHRAGAEAFLMGATIRTNALGMRSPEIAERAEPGVARIAFVGDSITLGWGVAERDTFVHQVAAELARTGRNVEAFNLGVGNYNTTQELALFRDVGARLKPDIIVLCYFINDAEPMPQYLDAGWIDRHSAARTVVNYRIDALSRQFGDAPDWKHYYRMLYEPQAGGWRQTQKALSEFATLSRDSGSRMVVFHIPELRELKPYPFADITAKVRAVVERERVPFVDLLPAVEGLEPASLWVTAPDPHPNAKADLSFARAMLPVIATQVDELCRDQGKGCLAAP